MIEWFNLTGDLTDSIRDNFASIEDIYLSANYDLILSLSLKTLSRWLSLSIFSSKGLSTFIIASIFFVRSGVFSSNFFWISSFKGCSFFCCYLNLIWLIYCSPSCFVYYCLAKSRCLFFSSGFSKWLFFELIIEEIRTYELFATISLYSSANEGSSFPIPPTFVDEIFILLYIILLLSLFGLILMLSPILSDTLSILSYNLS